MFAGFSALGPGVVACTDRLSAGLGGARVLAPFARGDKNFEVERWKLTATMRMLPFRRCCRQNRAQISNRTSNPAAVAMIMMVSRDFDEADDNFSQDSRLSSEPSQLTAGNDGGDN